MCCLNEKVRICGKIRTIRKNVRDESCMTKMDTYCAFICCTLQRFWNCRKRDVTTSQWILPHFIRYCDSWRSNATNLCLSHQSAIDLNSTGRYSERLEATSGNIRKLQPCVIGNVIPALWKTSFMLYHGISNSKVRALRVCSVSRTCERQLREYLRKKKKENGASRLKIRVSRLQDVPRWSESEADKKQNTCLSTPYNFYPKYYFVTFVFLQVLQHSRWNSDTQYRKW